ncbi:MAG: methylated-DNA--[protein]-cysteine S-methyltransferase [Rhodocyclaceae bacterium]|nr:MAG: methylated-DNA--[protein]-cysteine S-methyltransferase [Rhodocyclaceae bacterium]
MTTYYLLHDSPVGELLLVCNGKAITDLHIMAGKYVPAVDSDWIHDERQAVLRQAQRELDEYFAGRLRTFAVPLAPQGTDFQKRAWAALSKIPFGETWTYAQQAYAIGRPTAVRAVGAANGKNPIGIMVPCHRVIGANGTLTGYAGGLGNKAFLLKLEGVL